MDPRAAAAQQAFLVALHALTVEYVQLMQRMGVKSSPVHHV